MMCFSYSRFFCFLISTASCVRIHIPEMTKRSLHSVQNEIFSISVCESLSVRFLCIYLCVVYICVLYTFVFNLYEFYIFVQKCVAHTRATREKQQRHAHTHTHPHMGLYICIYICIISIYINIFTFFLFVHTSGTHAGLCFYYG